MNNENPLTLSEAALPYEVRHSIWDPSETEAQLKERGMYEPDAVYLFSAPESEMDNHVEEVEQLVEDIETPETVYFNADAEEEFETALNTLSGAEHVPISYEEPASRQADFQALNQHFDGDETFLGVAQDYSVPRNHREAARNIDEWEGPENGFAFDVEDPNERGSSILNYVTDRLNTRSWLKEVPEYRGNVELKDGQHFIVGTTYSEDFEDYSSKFGVGRESELIRTVAGQDFKDRIKQLPFIDEFSGDNSPI